MNAVGAGSSAGASRGVLAIAALTVFLDIVGFSILFPIFADLLHHYETVEDGSARWARDLVSLILPNAEPGRRAALFGGLLLAGYSLLQFVAAPIWGRLSDRIGRRPVLLCTTAGIVFANLLWVFADGFAWMVASRLLAGAMAGNIAVATAVVADRSSREGRTRAMAFIGMALGLGFVVGPGLGAAAMVLLPGPSSDGLGLGLHPFSGPAAIAAGLAVLNCLWVWWRLPETRVASVNAGEGRLLDPRRILGRGLPAGLARLNRAYLVLIIAFSAMETALVFLAYDQLGWTHRELGLLFVELGLLGALVQGGLVRRIARAGREPLLATLGCIILMFAFALLASQVPWPSGWRMHVTVVLLALGSGLALPTITGLASVIAPAERQGEALGAFRSAGALGRAIGPMGGGWLYAVLGPAAPFLAGLALLPLSVVLLLTLRQHGQRGWRSVEATQAPSLTEAT